MPRTLLESRLLGGWFFILLGMLIATPLSGLAQSSSETDSQEFNLSLAVSEEFLQTYFTAEYHGQDVSTEKDQAFGFENVRIRLKKGRVTIKTDFWYKKFLTHAKESVLLDVAGFLETSFTTIYLPEKKQIKLAKSSIERLKLTKGSHLKFLLEPLLRTALDQVIVWKKIDHLILGPYAKIPVNTVEIDLREKGVVVHLNQPSLIPPALLKEMFVISVTESTLNTALLKTAPHIFPAVLGEIADENGTRYQVTLSGAPVIDVSPGKSVGLGEMKFQLPLLFQPATASSAESFDLTLGLRATPHLEGEGKQVHFSLELASQFELLSENSATARPWLQTALQEAVLQIQTLLSELKVAIPPIQFIPQAQHMQLSQIVLDNNQMGVAATLVKEQ